MRLAPLIAALLTVVAWQPFMRPDFDVWSADDGEYHLLRVYVFEAAFRSGQWLPRWTPDLFLGFGYPIFNFYAPGTYYAALVLRALGLDVFGTVQALGAIATCAGAAGAYSLTRALFGGVWPGLVAAVAYAYAPYPFITNLLIRADLAEALGLALLPWALLAAWRAGKIPTAWHAAQVALAMGAVVLTHNLTALVALPMAGALSLFAALSGPREVWQRALPHVGAGLVLALALTAFFWLPAMVEQRHVQIEVALGGGHKSPRSWLIEPLGVTDQTSHANNPQTAAGPLDLHLSYPYDLNYPPKPSLGQGALFLTSTIAIIAGALRRRRGSGTALFLLGGTLFLWLLTTTWSGWAWDNVPLMAFLQFSWRLYGPLGLGIGLTAGAATALVARLTLRRSTAVALTALPVALAALLALNTTTARALWIDPATEHQAGGSQLTATENTLFGAGTTTGGEFVPRTVDLQGYGERRYGNGLYERLYPEFGWVAGRVLPLDGRMQVTSLTSGTTWTNVLVEAETAGTLAFRTLAFPGWRAYLDGKEVPPVTAPPDQQLGIAPGFLVIQIPPGMHQVQIAFSPTRVRTASAAVSVAALAVGGWWLAAGRGLKGVQLALALLPAALMALSCTHDTVRPVLAPPARPSARDERLVMDLLAAARGGRATLSSPSGSGLGPFLDVQRMRLGDRERAWLYMHPPASAAFELELPSHAAFQAGLGMDPRMWDAPHGDGVRFVAEVTQLSGVGAGETVRVLDEPVNPRASGEDRRWLDRWIDLSAFGGQRVRLTLRTENLATSDNDWAGWASPTIFIQRDARRPGGGPPIPVPTPRAS